MILLKSISVQDRQAELVPCATRTADFSMPAVLTAASALGLHRLRLHDAHGGHDDVELPIQASGNAPIDPSRATYDVGLEEPRAERAWKHLDAVLRQHRCSVQEDQLIYDAVFAHEAVAPPLIAAYVSLLLATVGTRESHILQFRLAMYEICANIVEHGIVQHPAAEIGIHLAFTPGEASGWIQDACDRFDLSAQPVGSIKEQAATRASRGYGIHMLRQLLQSMDHEFNTTGNRIHFRKRMAP
jgi:anti-sigma regulatory factor (Ser/Thr protein kinase)